MKLISWNVNGIRAVAQKGFEAFLLEHQPDIDIICGDMNVAHGPIDLARPKPNEGSAGYTLEERQGMTNYVHANLVDTFRTLNPEKVQYSWWSYLGGARENNVGWRIDYFLATHTLLPLVQSSTILDHVTGSDHCPVELCISTQKI